MFFLLLLFFKLFQTFPHPHSFAPAAAMLEARLVQGGMLKKVVDAVKDLVTEANIDVSTSGFALQAMDTSHVSLIAMHLRSDAFEHFRCDRPMSMGAYMLRGKGSTLR